MRNNADERPKRPNLIGTDMCQCNFILYSTYTYAYIMQRSSYSRVVTLNKKEIVFENFKYVIGRNGNMMSCMVIVKANDTDKLKISK